MTSAAITSTPGTRQQSGFVLAATLWVVAILLLVVVGFEAYISSGLERSHRLRTKVERSLEVLATEHMLRYALSTHRQTLAGVDVQTEDINSLRNEDGLLSVMPVGGEIRLDGRPYRGVGDVYYSLQDELGLVSLNAANRQMLQTFLTALGLSQLESQQMIDRLRDYRDSDNYRNLHGAEAAAYERLSLQPPPNDYLRTNRELVSVLGWDQWLQSLPVPDVLALFSTLRGSKVNTTTMPAALLDLIVEDGETFLESRERQAFRDSDAVKKLLPELATWSDEAFAFFAGSRLRIRIWHSDSIQSLVIGLELSPFNVRGPVREHYRYEAPLPQHLRLTSADRQALPRPFESLTAL